MKRILTILLITAMVFSRTTLALADDASSVTVTPVPSEVPATSVTPAPPVTPEAPITPVAPDMPSVAPKQPDAPITPVPPATLTVTPKPTQTPKDPKKPEQPATPAADDPSQDDAAATTPPPTGQIANGNVGDTTITTGDATSGSSATTVENTNVASSGGCTSACASSDPSASVTSSGNGVDSQNSGSATVSNSNTTGQANSAYVTNNVQGATDTGSNSASRNVGNSTISTGNANTTGTAITAVNTNVSGVAVAEFNVNNDYTGDLVLSPEAIAQNCISGCGSLGGAAANTGNGAGSDNSAQVIASDSAGTFQTNDATVGNTITLGANTGYNTTESNTDGNSTVNTGNANVEANSLTFANNNLDGDVIYNSVNIFGNLDGDIILPESTVAATGDTLSNTGNGTDSNNTTSLNTAGSNTTAQNNAANIQNNLNFAATTGDNSADRNTNGASDITSGTANVQANVLNIANTNIADGNMWLVLVNQAGKWIGELVGAPDGSSMAGSAGTIFTVGDDGQVTASNGNNADGSTNTASVSQGNTTATTQTNTANVANNITLAANTGGNTASRNTGGDSSVTTGNANVVANIVNFVNNNITGHGKLVVTVVNVFGTWLGDFIAPGQQKPAAVTSSDQTASTQIASSGSTQGQSGSQTATNPVVSLIQTAAASITGANVQPATTTTTGGSVSTTVGHGAKIVISDQRVAGMSTSNVLGNSGTVSRRITINLAWAIMFLPLLLMWLLGKKVVLPYLRK